MTNIKKGDRVKVTVEGVVRGINSRYLSIESEAQWLGEIRHDLVAVEKIEPPVEVFKPGDVVRAREGGATVALDKAGYTYLTNSYGQVGSRFLYRDGYRANQFTSKDYERVTIE